MLHLHAADGTGPDGGAAGDALHFGQADVLAGLQELQVLVDAAVITAAIRPRPRAFPLLLTLPAELVGLLLVRGANDTLDTQVGQIFPLHGGFTFWTLMQRERFSRQVPVFYLV